MSDPDREAGRITAGDDLREVRERELATLEVPTLAPRAQQIVEVALELLEEGGPDAVSMRVVAGRLGVRAPSLYKHLPDKGAMENAMIAIGLRQQGAACEEGMRGADDPLTGVAQAFRRWGKEHRHLYELMMAAPLDPGPLVRSAELVAGRALREAMQGDAVGAFTVWSFAHGLLSLELQDRLPPGADVEVLWARGIDALRPR
ncbi:TetR/AcrR family transcriptional regulator [Patulibacter sp.]|uniref:TetR/AcrR family transcriptional regulator n=1 Tax=Patulibacter sp. TaxID=1912859 RepID=UPI00271659BF|nr:TetR/AcrR family transcriptional regulator [Patulibacter sp.]MDO9407094.1 TetR/AcrR family transcriptional regulator [Patulibacter sp.]